MGIIQTPRTIITHPNNDNIEALLESRNVTGHFAVPIATTREKTW
jgi:hypothetical protein